MKRPINYYKQGIVAIIPMYIDMKGDGTKILTENKGEHYEVKSIKRVLNHLAKIQQLDLRECKRYYGEKLGYKILMPIPLNKDTILIPAKTRTAVSKNDGAFAYVNLKHIEKIQSDNRNGIIILKDKREIITRQRTKTIEKHIRNGRLIEGMLNEEYVERAMEEDLFEEYNAPATKGDIMALRNELKHIKQKLNT